MRDAQARVRESAWRWAGKDSAGRSRGRNAPLSPKKSGRMQENGEVSKKSPQVFAERVEEGKIRNIFFEKTALFRNKRFTFAADKTQPSLFPPQCGVHIAAIFGIYSPEFQRKCSLTYCKKARRSTGEASGLSKTCVIRLRSSVYSEQNRLRWIDRGHLGYVFNLFATKGGSSSRNLSLRCHRWASSVGRKRASVERKRLSNARLCGLSDRALQRRRGKHLRLGFRCQGGAPH